MGDLQISLSWGAVVSLIISIIKKYIPNSEKYSIHITWILSGLGVFLYHLSVGSPAKLAFWMAVTAMFTSSGSYNMISKPIAKSIKESSIKENVTLTNKVEVLLEQVKTLTSKLAKTIIKK